MTEILAKVIRGDIVESVHRGHIAIVDGDGRIIAQIGNAETITFIRSAAKPFQVLPFLLNGAEELGFREPEIAMACGSHSGEKMHTSVVEEMLQKAGFSEPDLRCGRHLPFDEKRAKEMLMSGERPSQLHNNCSGKHAAMLAFARHIGADTNNYELPDHPVQQEILRTVSAFSGIPPEHIPLAVDGCALPNFALPLSAMARSFVRLVFPPEEFDDALRQACRKIVSAMTAYPEFIGGSHRLDTILMRAARGKFISKVGAEGVWLCGVLPCDKWPGGLGIALKIEDGEDTRARPVVAIEVLRQLGVIGRETLKTYSPLPVKNRRNDIIGRVVPDFTIWN